MARRRTQVPAENHERWLISYADFITLLFAFFVVLFASGQTDRQRVRQVSEAMREATEGQGTRMKAAMAAVLGGTVDDKGQGNAQRHGPGGSQRSQQQVPPASTAMPSVKALTDQLQKEIAAGQMQVSLESRGLRISLRQATFFPSGEDSIPPETYQSLTKVAAAIRGVPNAIRLEGHTDAIPIRTKRYRSNWDLSAARSIAVMELLAEKFQVPRTRMAIAAYADLVPIDSNETPEGRSHNRRVDIIVLNEKALSAEPRSQDR